MCQKSLLQCRPYFMAAVSATLEKLMDDRATMSVSAAGTMLLGELSGNALQRALCLKDPLRLTAPPFLAPRYLAQVTLRALREEYESIDELIDCLLFFADR